MTQRCRFNYLFKGKSGNRDLDESEYVGNWCRYWIFIWMLKCGCEIWGRRLYHTSINSLYYTTWDMAKTGPKRNELLKLLVQCQLPLVWEVEEIAFFKYWIFISDIRENTFNLILIFRTGRKIELWYSYSGWLSDNWLCSRNQTLECQTGIFGEEEQPSIP